MKFKRYSAALVCAAVLSATTWAASPDAPSATGAAVAGESFVPFRTLQMNIQDDAKVVRLFFSFSCPHCFQSHDPIVRWGYSLPATLRFEVTPVVTRDAASVMGAAFYYAVKMTAPLKLPLFSTAVYDAIQRQSARPDKEETYLQAASRAGIPPGPLRQMVRSQKVMEATYRAGQLVAAYKLDATPSVTTGGRYVVTPEATQGINGNFFQLINAVASKHMIEIGSPG
jgi:thiol:disulfide interchange protein DsbA